MLDRIPDTLFRTKRGLCPCCGAPLPLGEDTSNLTCAFCGARAVLERRLRRAEPEVAGAPLRQFDAHDHAGWTRTDRLRETFSERPTCPGCAQGIDPPEESSRFACPTCGTECHLERRLVPPPKHPLRSVPRPRHPRETYVYDLKADEDPATEHLIYRLSVETDIDRLNDLAGCFEQWSFINATTSRLMPAIVERMHLGHRPLTFALSSAIDKCLCSDGAKARETVEALEEWVMRVPAEPQIISSLGLGTALGLKLLLDSSMLAYKAGDLAQSVACLFSINWMLQRNYPEHPIISQILMHRMFYLSGPPLAFCVQFMHGQVSDVAFRYDPKTTLAFLDDAVAERPILVPSLDHERAFWCGHSASEADWNDRWAFYQTLRTDEARLAAWRHYLGPPEKASAEFYEGHIARLLTMLEDERPAWRDLAERRLEWMIRRLDPTPEAFFRLVAERGESLPGHVRQAMLSTHPKCGLAHKNLPYWQPEPKAVEHPEIVAARQQYRDGLDLHLASKKDDREEWQAYWEARGGRPKGGPPIFDGKSEGPAPDESDRRHRRPAPRPWEDDVVGAGAGESTDSVGSENRGRPAPGDETAPPADDELAELRALSEAEGRASNATRGSAADADDDQDDGDDQDVESDSVGGASAGAAAGSQGTIPNDGSVTIWEWVASLPPEQQRQYDETLKQLEPHRAMMEAAIAAQRGHAPNPDSRPPPGSQTAPPPGEANQPGLLGKLFGRKKKG